MSRVPASARSLVRFASLAAVASLTLAACGTSATNERVVGIPSISISVPLETVACTTSNSCIAVGTSSATIGPPSVGQFRLASGRWRPIAVPAVASSFVAAASCWDTKCLLGGSQPSGDLLLRYDSLHQTVTSLRTPPGAYGINAVNCYAVQSCAIVDVATDGARFSVTADGGETWTTPLPIAMTAGDTVTGLACAAEFNCMVATTSTSKHLLLYTTSDGGATWVATATPGSWRVMRSLWCDGARCVGLVETADGSRIIKSSTFGSHWSSVALAQSGDALACTPSGRCVVAGQKGSEEPWLATLRDTSVTTLALRYVPSPLLDVACGSKECVAIAVTTVLALRP
jgi:hypothetical protein